MNSAAYFGNTETTSSAGLAPAPPPPPPPPVPGQVPVMRIRNAETPISKRPVSSGNDAYEPPAAIQNAMMTKDKKPFTYTPGMGGKLDLSQIRSPRMARRVAKNANDEGIEGPPKSPLAGEGARPVSTGASVYIQPQVAVPVFPTNIVPVQVNRPHQTNRLQINPPDKSQEAPRSMVKLETRSPSQPDTPETPTTPPQVNLTRAPTPWLQNKTKPQEELPEWAKRSGTNGSSSYSPPESPMANKTVQQPQIRIIQQVRPVQAQQAERVIPLNVEDRPSVFSAKNDPGAPGHHQLKQTPPHHQSRWLPAQQSAPNPPRSVPQSGGSYNIPIVIEGAPEKKAQVVVTPPYQQQSEPGPVQSRSFRVLQKITDTDDEDIDPDQLRRLQLTEDDKMLMNKFKEQVDGDTYLHQEEDPRYRGATIPSRAFRYLQNITDSGEPVINTNEETQANLPPSEQQVQEPKKYTGSAIPSRSFRILQAMTSPESVANQEIRRADFTRQNENSMMQVTQPIVLMPRYSQPIYWAYYPIPCPINQPNHYLHNNNNECNNIIGDNIVSSCYTYSACEDEKYASTSIDNNTLCAYNSICFCNYCTSLYINNITKIHQKDRNYNNCLEVSESSGNWMALDVDECHEARKINHCSSIDRGNDILLKANDEILYEDVNVIDQKEKNYGDNTVSTEDDNSDTTSPSSASSITENCRIDEKADNTDSSSSESDSDSYLAYSTGFDSRKINDTGEINEIADEKCVNIQDNEKNELLNGNNEFSTTVCVSLPFRKNSTPVKSAKTSKSNLSSEFVDSSTSVEFTFRRNGSTRPKSWCPEKSNDEFSTSETIVRKTALSPVIFNLRNVENVEDSRDKKNLEKTTGFKLVPQFEITVEDDKKDAEEEEKEEDDEEETNFTSKNDKLLLAVGNSRGDETDDEDSGVTSDMSRIISEVDTDSESTPIQRKISSYKRTQTHSRLFRLLSGDSVLSANSSSFNYDNSNDSSGLTSPDLSPISEVSWRKFQVSGNARKNDSTGRDPYFRTWKNKKAQNQDFSSASMTSRISQNGNNFTAWTYKTNVSCPRIKSTKNVPRTMKKTIS